MKKYYIEIVNPEKTISTTSAIDCIVLECKGGGFICHDSFDKKIEVFGTSVTFGQEQRELTISYLQKAFPNYQKSKFFYTYNALIVQ